MNRLLSAALLVMPLLAATPCQAAPATPTASAIIPLPLEPVVPAALRTCSAKTPSGLGFTMLRPATGARPGATDYVLVNYIGFLAANGQVFDQSMQTPMQVSGVISGFAEGLQMVGKDGIYRLCIPAALGYGATETGPIPANSDLVFQIEVLDSKTAEQVEALRAAAKAQEPVPAP